MSKLKVSKNVTIGKIVLSLIAIGVLFVPVYAVQSIEARAVTHALEIEGLYVNGTALELIDMTNDTRDQIEAFYNMATVNNSVGDDSVLMLKENYVLPNLLYRDRVSYIGNDTYSISYNVSEEPSGTVETRKLYIPLNINATQLLEPDFVRVLSDCEATPELFICTGTSGLELSPLHEVSTDNYIFINTIQTRSQIAWHEDSQVFLVYSFISEPDLTTWEVKLQKEIFEGDDVFTWNDDTLYIVAILLCDVLLIGAIVFASDPIDIKIDRDKKRR